MNIVDSSGWLEYFADGPNADFFASGIETVGELVVPSIIYFQFGDLRTKPPFSDKPERLEEFLPRLNEIDGISIPDEAIDKDPRIWLSTFNNDEAALNQFLKVLDWFVREVKAT